MMALSALRPPLRVKTPINEVKEVLFHIRYCPQFPRMCYNITNSADSDETPQNAASHLGLRYL